MLKTSVIFFDAGDTLVFDNPPLRERFQRAALRAGLSIKSDCFPSAWQAAEQAGLQAYLQGADDLDILQRSAEAAFVVMGYGKLTHVEWTALRTEFAAETYARYVYPGVFPLLSTLKERGFRLGIISDWEANLPDVLTSLGLADYFDCVLTSAGAGVTKPHPRLFSSALAQMNVPPDRALHVGDWFALDIAGAQAAGIPALLFDHAGRSPYAPCPRAATFDALAAYLKSLPTPRSHDMP